MNKKQYSWQALVLFLFFLSKKSHGGHSNKGGGSHGSFTGSFLFPVS